MIYIYGEAPTVHFKSIYGRATRDKAPKMIFQWYLVRYDDRDVIHEIWKRTRRNHWCNLVMKEMSSIRERSDRNSIIHKEEREGRIVADKKDRNKIRGFLTSLYPPLGYRFP